MCDIHSFGNRGRFQNSGGGERAAASRPEIFIMGLDTGEVSNPLEGAQAIVPDKSLASLAGVVPNLGVCVLSRFHHLRSIVRLPQD